MRLFAILIIATVALTPVMASAQGNSERLLPARPDSSDTTGGSGNNAGPGNSGNSARPDAAGRPGSAGPSTDRQDNGLHSPQGGQASAAGAEPSSQEYAAQAVSSGRAVPLDRVLGPAQDQTGGTLIDTRLLTVDGFLLYELKMLRADGTLDTLYYYAQTGNPVR